MKGKVALAILLELAYTTSTRLWLPQRVEGVALELWITALRLLSAAAIWLLFRDLIRSREPCVSAGDRSRLAIPLLLLLLSPVLAGSREHPDLGTQLVFAVCSLPVALREEFVYRGVLQNLLERRLGWLPAILVSNIVFALYHYGAQPFTPGSLLGLFVGGTFLGLLYRGTGSIFLVVTVHALYDAIVSFTPLLAKPAPQMIGHVMEITALLFCLAWVAGQRPQKNGTPSAMPRNRA